MINRLTIILLLLLGTLFFMGKPVHAQAIGGLTGISDTITTSRPSASAPIVNNPQAANATSITIYDNGSTFLASDSALVRPDPLTSETIGNSVLIASMSASGYPSAGQRNVYFGGACPGTGCLSTVHHAGDPIIVPVTARHTITFKTTHQILTAGGNGYITITFPGAANNTASPSATGFAFNGLLPGSVTWTGLGTSTCTTGVSSPSITCNVLTNNLVAGSTITVTIPNLINPTKIFPAGSADNWVVNISTQDNTGQLDSGQAAIATDESVQVQGTVQPYITFTIAGIANGNDACGDTTNPGVGRGASASFVDLGNLNQAQVNVSGQTAVLTLLPPLLREDFGILPPALPLSMLTAQALSDLLQMTQLRQAR
jgi:hypothetical protein